MVSVVRVRPSIVILETKTCSGAQALTRGRKELSKKLDFALFSAPSVPVAGLRRGKLRAA
jgi:hypothetical protein